MLRLVCGLSPSVNSGEPIHVKPNGVYRAIDSPGQPQTSIIEKCNSAWCMPIKLSVTSLSSRCFAGTSALQFALSNWSRVSHILT